MRSSSSTSSTQPRDSDWQECSEYFICPGSGEGVFSGQPLPPIGAPRDGKLVQVDGTGGAADRRSRTAAEPVEQSRTDRRLEYRAVTGIAVAGNRSLQGRRSDRPGED